MNMTHLYLTNLPKHTYLDLYSNYFSQFGCIYEIENTLFKYEVKSEYDLILKVNYLCLYF